MRNKNQKRYIYLTDEQVRKLIPMIVTARNVFLSKHLPTEDVDALLEAIIRLQKKHRVKIKY